MKDDNETQLAVRNLGLCVSQCPFHHAISIIFQQKLENAKKLRVLSLSEHSLIEVPSQVFDTDLRGLRTVDLSKNNLKGLGPLHVLKELKSINLDFNDLHAGTLNFVSSLPKLQNLSVANNKLATSIISGVHQARQASSESLPELPPALKQVNLSANEFVSIPKSLCSASLVNLDRIDLSNNQICNVAVELTALPNLSELNLDKNMISSLPEEMGRLKQLKSLSLRDNRITVASTVFTESNPQPLPKSLFSNTLLLDLNLHGNKLTNTQLNTFDGFQDFLDRRQKVKSKLLTNLDLCGLE